MTRYLLVGNGDIPNLQAAVAGADIIIQINACRHFDSIPISKTKWIFITNSGDISMDIIRKLYDNKAVLNSGQMAVYARNPLFYRLKRTACSDGSPTWATFEVNRIHKFVHLKRKTVSFLSNMRLELTLRKLGMPIHFMPSTGMIAYDWISRRMRKKDSLAIAGFTFEGWDHHPWDIEKKLIIAIPPIQTHRLNKWQK